MGLPLKGTGCALDSEAASLDQGGGLSGRKRISIHGQGGAMPCGYRGFSMCLGRLTTCVTAIHQMSAMPIE